MQLYFSPTSPYARKVRVVLLEKGVPFEPIDVVATTRSAAEQNPLGKVPTLILDDGVALFDSTVIVDALEDLFPEPRLVPERGVARARVRRWEALADGICDVLVPAVLERRRPAERQDPEYIAKLERKVDAALGYAGRAVEGGAYLEGGAFTLADAALCSAVGYVELRRPELLAGHPMVRAYAARLLERPSLAATIPPNLPVRG